MRQAYCSSYRIPHRLHGCAFNSRLGLHEEMSKRIHFSTAVDIYKWTRQDSHSITAQHCCTEYNNSIITYADDSRGSKAQFPLPELTARVDGWPFPLPVSWARFPPVELTVRQLGWWKPRARKHGPCWRVIETGHPSSQAVNSGRQLG